jgi:hypothetical protein
VGEMEIEGKSETIFGPVSFKNFKELAIFVKENLY